MKIIEYKQLYTHLVEVEKLHPWEAIRNIAKIRKLAPEILIAMKSWSRGVIPEISINGVSYAELTDIEGLQPIQAFLMLDWLKREPLAAMRFMEEERLRTPIQPLSAEELDIVAQGIKRLNEFGVNRKDAPIINSIEELPETQKTDIELEQTK